MDDEAARELVELIMRQREKNHPVPDDSLVVVESGGEGAIINCCFGHKTNDTLGRVITSILSARFGSSVALQIDPIPNRADRSQSAFWRKRSRS